MTKTAQQIRDEVAKERGYKSFKHAVEYKAAYDGVTEYPLTKELTEILDIATERYAKQESPKSGECTKPNCNCLEIAEQKNGGQGVKNYPCLAIDKRVAEVKSPKPPEISAEEVWNRYKIDLSVAYEAGGMGTVKHRDELITKDRFLKATEEYHRLNSQGNGSVIKDKTFEEYLKKEKHIFILFLHELKLNTSQRVKAEDFVIAFDNLRERWLKTVSPTYVSDEEIKPPKVEDSPEGFAYLEGYQDGFKDMRSLIFKEGKPKEVDLPSDEIKILINDLTCIGQLILGFKPDAVTGGYWSEWDEQQVDAIHKWLKKLYPLTDLPQPK